MSQERSSAGQRNVGWVQPVLVILDIDSCGNGGSVDSCMVGYLQMRVGCPKVSQGVRTMLADLYAHFSWHIPVARFDFAIGMIIYLRETHQAWRMRYAICWMILFAVALGYMCVYHWDGLQGNQSPAETLGNIGLAAVGVATLLFVVWRGRLVGQANQIARNQSLPERYQRAGAMLRNDDPLVRVGVST